MPGDRKYSDGEIREILDRAMQNQGPDATGITHADLLAIGEQVGVPPEAMARAATEALQAKLDTDATRSLKARGRQWLATHAGVFAVVNGLLFAVNYLTTPGEWWVLFSVFFWGLALAAHTGVAAALGKSPSPRALQRERRRLEAARPRLRVDAPASAEPAVEAAAEEVAEAERATSRL